jgi:enterochelin esterase-like enzyme
MRRRGLTVGVPLLLVTSTLFLHACTFDGGNPAGTASSAPTATGVPAPFWQTATARVVAAQSPAASLLRTFAPSPTPVPSATTPPSGDTAQANTAMTAAIPSGSQLLDRTFMSAALGREMHYFIYLPAGYAESGKQYPVLYLLHGYGGSNTEWIGYGLPEMADTMMDADEIPRMIIVLPQGDQANWVNHADQGERWGEYTAQDVVQFIDATYRTIPDAAHRAIGGLSMGAHGAMQLALNYPGTFGVVGMHSPTLRDYQGMKDLVGFFGDEAYFDAHDPIHLMQDYPDRARQLKILLDVGEQDEEWHDRVVVFDGLLTQLDIPHDFRTWPGSHDAEYWSGHAADYLRFYAAALSG